LLERREQMLRATAACRSDRSTSDLPYAAAALCCGLSLPRRFHTRRRRRPAIRGPATPLPIWGAMQTGLFSADDELLARLQAPPDLGDGVESLAYWRGRRARLPWYRARARREASRMILVWERRLLAAVLAQRGTPLWARVRAARLVAVGPLRRWARRGGFVLAAAMLTLLAPAVLAAELLVRSI
jgi:hypothetical protein